MFRASLAVSAALLLPLALIGAPAATRHVDHRYSPPTWHAALGWPGDWHEPMADERGALLFDFGPGPYAKPLTSVDFTLADQDPAPIAQRWADATAPIIATERRSATAKLEITTLSLPPETAAASLARFPTYERLDGIPGAKGWARPSDGTAPEFSSVAWGTNRPLRYRLRVPAGAAKRVVLGFCESWKPRLNERVAEMQVEGAPTQTVDLALTAARHAPQVFTFLGHDTDRDGWLHVTVSAPAGHDPNTTLSYLALYAPDAKFTREDLLAGRGAELRVDCGAESDALPVRFDVISAVATDADPVLSVRTGRTLRWDDAAGVLRDGDRPFVVPSPRPTRVEPTPEGWTFAFGTRTAHAVVLSGAADDSALSTARTLAPAAVIARTQERWRSTSPVPALAFRLGDPRLEALVRDSLRIVYQGWEVIEERGQFNSSFTLYRGLWAGDVVYAVELAALVGDRDRAREQLRTLWRAQNAVGLIDEMPPLRLTRTTGAVLWATHREAELSADLTLARELWPAVRRAVAALRALRTSTLNQDVPWAGLLPPGFNDGGIMDVTAEYSSVYWSITGLRAAATLAGQLGEKADAESFRALATEFETSFHAAARRDLRRDAAGNAFLPVRVGRFVAEEPPQLAQWAVLEAGLFGDWLPRNATLIDGTLGVLRAAERQGLPVSTGWMRDGVWAGYGSLYAHLPLLRGERDRAIDLFYAIANHASPLGGWIEEQSLAGEPLRLAGDQPHCWASALFVRLALSLLAHERDGEIHLLAGLAPDWLGAGATNAVAALPTRFGPVSVSVEVASDGQAVRLRATAPARASAVVHADALREAGFALPGGRDEPLRLAAGESVDLTLPRVSAPRSSGRP